MTDSSSTGRALAIMMLAAAALVVGAGMGSAATTWYPNDCGDQTIAYSWSCTEQTTIVSPAITTRGNIGIDNDTIVVDIKLLDTPATLTFDQDFTPDDAREHEWGVYIDVDNNPSTGSSYRVEGCEVAISLENFKFPGSTQHDDTILGGTQHNTWIFNETTRQWRRSRAHSASVW